MESAPILVLEVVATEQQIELPIPISGVGATNKEVEPSVPIGKSISLGLEIFA